MPEKRTLPVVTACAVFLAVSAAFAQTEPTPPPPPPAAPAANPPPAAPAAPSEPVAPPAAAAPAPASLAPSEHYFGIHTGVNLGMIQVDMMSGRFYGAASTTLGVPLLSNGQWVVGNVMLGYNLAISSPNESMWYFDIFAQVLPGRLQLSGNSGGGYCGFGFGVGLRYLHRSGLTLGLRLPVFGFGFGDAANDGNGSFNGPSSVGSYYLANLASSSIFTIGFRF